MVQFFNFLSVFDMFSVTFTQSLRPKKNSSTYKSILGGVVSLIICTLGLMYSGNLILKWIDNSLIMKISSQQEHYNSSTFYQIFVTQTFNSQFLINIIHTDIDPFVNDEIYVIPLLLNLTSGEIQNVIHNYLGDSYLDITLNDSLEYHQYQLILVQCFGNEQFLSSQQKCASQESQANFFSTPGLQVDVHVTTSTIDVYTAEVTQTMTYMPMYIQKTIIPEYTVLLDYTYYELRQGQFFSQTTKNYMLSTAYKFHTAFCEPGFLEAGLAKYFSESSGVITNVVAQMYLGTGINVNHVIAEYPSVSEILANIGSTFQTMLLLKYLIFYFNKYLMIEEFRAFCRDLYFPEIKGITQVKKGKVHLLYHENKRLEPKKYFQFLKDLNKKIDQKMNFANLIYEISKMQIILQDLAIRSSQQKRSALKLKLDEKTQLYEIVNNFNQKDNDNLIMDSTIDPFIYSYPIGKVVKKAISQDQKDMMKSETQFQREILILHENEEIQIENRNIIYSESLRPQQSF